MKKIKFFSVFVIVLSVIVLGLLSGKQFFSYLEAKASGQFATSSNNEMNVKKMAGASSTIVLYSARAEEQKPAESSSPPVEKVAPPAETTAAKEEKVEQVKTTAPVDVEKIDYQKHHWAALAAGNGINVRDVPSTEKPSKAIFKVGQGTKGRILERKDGWTRVKWAFNKKSGWTRDDLLVFGPANVVSDLSEKAGGTKNISQADLAKANNKAIQSVKTVSFAVAKPALPSETVKGFTGGKPPEQGEIRASPVANIRSEPTRRSTLLGKLPKGVTVQIKSFKKVGKYNWFEIVYHKGRKHGWTRGDNISFNQP